MTVPTYENLKGRQDVVPLTQEVIELPLLLPHWEVTALERAAHEFGLTPAQMIRHLIQDFLRRSAAPRPYRDDGTVP